MFKINREFALDCVYKIIMERNPKSLELYCAWKNSTDL